MKHLTGVDRSASYMARNDAMVAHGPAYDMTLQAFPLTKTEQLRSGTWATVRRARKFGVPDILITPLSS